MVTSTSFWIISYGAFHLMNPHTRRGMPPSWRRCLLDAAWCVRSDVVSKLGLQAYLVGEFNASGNPANARTGVVAAADHATRLGPLEVTTTAGATVRGAFLRPATVLKVARSEAAWVGGALDGPAAAASGVASDCLLYASAMDCTDPALCPDVLVALKLEMVGHSAGDLCPSPTLVRSSFRSQRADASLDCGGGAAAAVRTVLWAAAASQAVFNHDAHADRKSVVYIMVF